MISKENIKAYHYSLVSSSDVYSVGLEVEKIEASNVLVHIITKIHNTVLIHKLEKELKRIFQDVKIVFLTNSLSSIQLNIYTYDGNIKTESLHDLMIQGLDKKLVNNTQLLENATSKNINSYFRDQLTSLPNIYQLQKDLLENENAGLVFLKIDNFVTINSFYGFIVGDFVIEQVTHYLEKNIKNIVLYRNTGAEFILLLENNISFYDLKEYLIELYDTCKGLVVKYQEHNIHPEFTLASCANKNTDSLLSKVSMAMKYACDNRLPFWIYEDRMHFYNEYEKNMETAAVIRSALDNQRIIPYFQAIVDNENMKVVKFECLARLIDANGNIVSPNIFIDIAKKIKVYNLITRTIIDQSFAVFEKNDYEFNINLSIEDIMNSEIFDFIILKLKSSNIADKVTFELLESEAVKDFDKLKRFIDEVKRYGAKIAIDDFGSGYSNFAYITKIDVDYIKIDGSLISDIDTNKNSYMVVESIVHFAKKFKIQTVAEYVHSSTIVDKVKELKIDFSQGFIIDKPSPEID